MEKFKKFVSYVNSVGKSWLNIVFFVLDLLSFLAIYFNPSLTYLPILFTLFLLVSFAYSSFLYFEKTVGEEVSIIVKHKPVQRIYRVLEIYNASTYDIGDIEIRVEWEQSEGSQFRNLEDAVVDVNAEIVKVSPSQLSVLKSKEKVWAVNVPHHSTDGKMNVVIKGLRLDIGKPFIFEKEIEVPKVAK
ncbi:MAG: hypothetical protein PHE21_00620 [Candidatus Dojkabacteria bacterium]|nr:hypothetical protein [Candidatus Dojkabacteria bacterium]